MKFQYLKVVEVIPKMQPEGTSNHCVLAKACLKALHFLKRKSCCVGYHMSAHWHWQPPMAWVKRLASANRVTIIRNYVYFNRLYSIMYDYLRLYPIICYYSMTKIQTIIRNYFKGRLFHWLHYDYFTYFFSAYIIAIIAIIAIMCIIFIAIYYTYYFIWDALLRLFFQSRLCALCVLFHWCVLLLERLSFSYAIIHIICFNTLSLL